MMDGGYIRLWRRLLDWEWYDDTNCKVVFLHCLLKANYKEKQWKGKIIIRGQFFTSVENLANELHLTTKQIRTTLSKLESTGEIIKKGANEGTYITICNYDNYQYSGQAEGQAEGERGASEGQAEGERGATTNKDKKEKKERKPRSKNDPSLKEDFSEFVNTYHEACPTRPRVLSLNGPRIRVLKARIKEYGREKVLEAFLAAGKSHFLINGNDKWRGLTFDWIIKSSNFLKIIEGNYSNIQRNGTKENYTGDRFGF